MWKYMDQNQSQEFLLSLHLLHNQLSDKEKVKMLYSISNSIEENYNIIKIKRNYNLFCRRVIISIQELYKLNYNISISHSYCR